MFFIFIQISIEHSVSNPWRPCYTASDLGLHCLPMSDKEDIRLIWLNRKMIFLFCSRDSI